MPKLEQLSLDRTDPWSQAGYSRDHVTRLTNLNELDWALRRDEDGDTLLHIAVAKGNVSACRKLVQILRREGRPLNVRNRIMQTPLHIACITANPDIVELLIENNPSGCDVTDRHGNNIVHLAIKHSKGDARLLRDVIEASSRVALEKRNIFGLAPIHLAALQGADAAVRMLRKAGTDINLPENKGGASPLILATRASQREAAQALLELGANPNLRTRYGETASQLASAKGDHVISEMLALYDTPYDNTKHSVLPRYTNDASSFLPDTHKQNALLTRRYDAKVKHDIINQRCFKSTPSKSPSRKEVPLVKTERKSPGAFPSGRKDAVAISNKSEPSDQPIDYVTKKTHENRSTLTQHLGKHKLPQNMPLDLTLKKTKKDEERKKEERNPSTDEFVASDKEVKSAKNVDRSGNFAFVHPVHPSHLAPSHLYYKVIPHPSPMIRHPSVSPHIQNALRGSCRSLPKENPKPDDAFQPIELRSGDMTSTNSCTNRRNVCSSSNNTRHRVRPIINHYNGLRHNDRTVGFIETQFVDQPIRTDMNENTHEDSQMRRRKNGVYLPFQSVGSRAMEERNQSQAFWNHVMSDATQPSKKSQIETREKFQPITKHLIEVRSTPQPITSRFNESRRHYYPINGHSVLEKKPSLPVVLDKMLPTEQDCLPGRDRQHFTDERRHNLPHPPIGKQLVERRNSAPVPAKGGEKIDLRSYTGCLPPHFLHLLESSGNLPIRTTNALRDVADVLKDCASRSDMKRDPPDKDHNNHQISNRPLMRRMSSFQADSNSSPGNVTLVECNSNDMTTTSKTSFYNAASSYQSLVNLDSWSGNQLQEYPAFGKFLAMQTDKLKAAPRLKLFDENFCINTDYVTEPTKLILRAVTVTSAGLQIPLMRPLVATGNKHTCPGCSRQHKQASDVINSIWRFTPHKRFAVASSEPTKLVYCCTSAATESSTFPVTSSSNDADVSTSSDKREHCRPIRLNTSSTSRVALLNVMFDELHKKRLTRHNSINGACALSRAESDDILANSIEDSSDDEQDQSNNLLKTNGSDVIMAKDDVIVLKKTNGFHKVMPRKNASKVSDKRIKMTSRCDMRLNEIEISDDDN